MNDEPCDNSALLPAGGPQHQGIRFQTNSLVQRGLALVATFAEQPRDVRAELALARESLDVAERLLNDPTAWDRFVRQCRDSFRHALLAMARHLRMDFEGFPDCADRLLKRSNEVQSDGLTSSLPRGCPDILPDYVNYFERLTTVIEADRAQAHLVWEMSADRDWSIDLSFIRLIIDDATELIERGAVGVVMPSMGTAMTEGTIVRWFKEIGESIHRDEALFEISTDKVDAEIPSPATGTLAAIFVKAGETVLFNTVVATIHTN